MTDEPDDTPIDRSALDAWATPPPPADFADRVLAARPETPAAPAAAGTDQADPAAAARRAARLRWSVVAVAACAALLLWVWRSGPGGAPALQATRRTPVRIGPDAVAVAEAGAALRWQVDADGARVDQRAGSVLYLVEPGSRFEVDTPHGRASVRGTSFRVEVTDMRIPKNALIGAAVGAALVVTVYEGRVLFAGGGRERELSAGQTLEVGPDGAPLLAGRGGPGALLAEWEQPPPAGASRDDLLARDGRQRVALAEARERERALRRQLAGARTDGAGASGGADSEGDRPWFDPGPETLRRWADECRVRNDFPGIFDAEPDLIGAQGAADMGLQENERTVLNELIRALHAEILTELRKLYIEVTGDAERADDLAPQALAAEILNKSAVGEEARVRTAIARERAGLQPAPTDLSQASALERWMRYQGRIGDELERRLAARLGPERAHELRAGERGPWGYRMEMAGCPREGEPDGR